MSETIERQTIHIPLHCESFHRYCLNLDGTNDAETRGDLAVDNKEIKIEDNINVVGFDEHMKK